MPASIIIVDYKITSMILLLMFCAIPFLIMKMIKNKNSQNKIFWDNLIFTIGMSLVFILPPLLSLIIYLPRSHYLLLLLPFLYIYFSPIAVLIKIKNGIFETLTFVLIVYFKFYLFAGFSINY
jgi:hypothetical protein